VTSELFGADSESWMTVEPEKLILNASGFWWRHTGARTTNVNSVRIEVPVANRLTSAAMENMLHASKQRFRA